jgi:hypothetical protein
MNQDQLNSSCPGFGKHPEVIIGVWPQGKIAPVPVPVLNVRFVALTCKVLIFF